MENEILAAASTYHCHRSFWSSPIQRSSYILKFGQVSKQVFTVPPLQPLLIVLQFWCSYFFNSFIFQQPYFSLRLTSTIQTYARSFLWKKILFFFLFPYHDRISVKVVIFSCFEVSKIDDKVYKRWTFINDHYKVKRNISLFKF